MQETKNVWSLVGSILALALARLRAPAIATLAFLPRVSAALDDDKAKSQYNGRDVSRTKTMSQAGEEEDVSADM